LYILINTFKLAFDTLCQSKNGVYKKIFKTVKIGGDRPV
jgi:hypothetical protein